MIKLQKDVEKVRNGISSQDNKGIVQDEKENYEESNMNEETTQKEENRT